MHPSKLRLKLRVLLSLSGVDMSWTTNLKGVQFSSKLAEANKLIVNNTNANAETALSQGNNIDDIITSAFTSSGVGALDKAISLASISGLLGERTNTIETGYNRATRRAFGLPKVV